MKSRQPAPMPRVRCQILTDRSKQQTRDRFRKRQKAAPVFEKAGAFYDPATNAKEKKEGLIQYEKAVIYK